MQGDIDGETIAIDVTVALEIRKLSNYWPLDRQREECPTLREDVRDDIEWCHLVPSGDLWELSFALHEQQRMGNLPSARMRALRAMQDCR